MEYPATLELVEEGVYVVTFPDIPEALTQGDDLSDALEMAQDALAVAMEFYLEDGRSVPPPSTARSGEYLISLPEGVGNQVKALNASLAAL